MKLLFPGASHLIRTTYKRSLRNYRGFPTMGINHLKNPTTTPPSNSRDPLIAKAQGEIFGNMDSYDNFVSGQKIYRKNGEAKLLALRRWYPSSEVEERRKLRKVIKLEIKRLEEENGPQQELDFWNRWREIFQKTPRQKRNEAKLAKLRARGKASPKKGMGKRAMKKS